MTLWTSYVKEFSKKNNIPYNEAVKLAKPGYAEWKRQQSCIVKPQENITSDKPKRTRKQKEPVQVPVVEPVVQQQVNDVNDEEEEVTFQPKKKATKKKSQQVRNNHYAQ
jgi:hypothetical protein